MNLPWRYSALFLLPCLLLSPSLAGAQDAEGEALAQRFLEHLKANTPIAGTFEVTTTFDPVLYEKREKALGKDVELNGKHYLRRSEPQKQFFRCRWVWDFRREMMDTPGDNYISRTFLHTPEGYLEKVGDKNFNLTARATGGAYRPASFYFLNATNVWSEIFTYKKGCKFHIEPAPVGSPSGSVLLIANPTADHEYRLLLDKTTCRLYDTESTFEGHPDMRLMIQHVEQDKEGKRVFPTKATITVYEPNEHKPWGVHTLTAKELVFPSRDEAEKLFQLIVPAETDIYDRVLNQHIRLTKPTLAEEVISSDPRSFPHLDMGPLPPLESQQTFVEKYGRALAILGIIGAFVLGVLVVLRSRIARVRRT